MVNKKPSKVVPFSGQRLVGIDGGGDVERGTVEVKILSISGNVVFESEAVSVMADDEYRCVAIDVVDKDGEKTSHIFVLGESFLLHVKRK